MSWTSWGCTKNIPHLTRTGLPGRTQDLQKKNISKNPQPGSEGAVGEERGCSIPGSLCPVLSKLLPPLAELEWKPGQDPVPEMEGECPGGKQSLFSIVTITQPELGLQPGLSDPISYVLSNPRGKCQRTPLSLSASISPQLLLFPLPPGIQGKLVSAKVPNLVLWAIFSSSCTSTHRELLSLCLPSLHRE